MRTHTTPRDAASSGFTLVEILVVMVVMAVGLLGGLALVLHGLRASRVALEQTGAVNLAADLADRIRANRTAGPAYALGTGTVLPPPAKACRSAGECDAGDVAAHDLYEWQQAALAALPGARTSVRVAAADGLAANVYQVRIEWTQAGRSTRANFALTVLA